MVSKIVANRANWAWPYAIVLFVFVVMPLVMIVYYSFQDVEGQWSLHNFHKFFLSTDSVNTLIYSIGIAMITTIQVDTNDVWEDWDMVGIRINPDDIRVLITN